MMHSIQSLGNCSKCFKQCQTPKQAIQEISKERRLPAPSYPFSAADLCFIRRWAPAKVRECYKKVTGQELTAYRRLQSPYQLEDRQSRFLYPFGPYVESPITVHGLYGLGLANLLFQPFHETIDQVTPPKVTFISTPLFKAFIGSETDQYFCKICPKTICLSLEYQN